MFRAAHIGSPRNDSSHANPGGIDQVHQHDQSTNDDPNPA